MNNKLLFLTAFVFVFARNVYSQHLMVVVPSFQEESRYEVYEIINKSTKSDSAMLDKQFSDDQLKEVSCDHLRHQLKEAEQLHRYADIDKPAWFYLEISDQGKDALPSLTAALIPCLSFETEAVIIKSVRVHAPDESVGMFDASPVMKNETDIETPLVLETTFDELASLGLASGTDESIPGILTLQKGWKEKIGFRGNRQDNGVTKNGQVDENNTDSNSVTGNNSDKPKAKSNKGGGPNRPPENKEDPVRTVNTTLSSWLSRVLAVLKFGGKTVVNVYIPGGSFFLHQSWPTVFVFETYKLGMISANFAYIHVHGFESVVDQVSENVSTNFSLPFVITALSGMNKPYQYSSMPFSKALTAVDGYLEERELRRIEKEKEEEEFRQQQAEKEKERLRQAEERLKEFKRMSLSEQLKQLTRVVRDNETGKVKFIFFSLKEFRKYYHGDAFGGDSNKEYLEIYEERHEFYKRQIEWAQYKERIDPDYYKGERAAERSRDWIKFNPMTIEKQGMLTFHQMTGCPEGKGKIMVSHDLERFSNLTNKDEKKKYQQGKVKYLYAAAYHFSLAEHETEKDKKEYHQKYMELFQKSHKQAQLEKPAGLVSLTRTICSKYGK